jgi:hypothetical protein
MADTGLPPVPYKVPIFDPTGLVSNAWAVWFRQVVVRIGGLNSATLADLATHLAAIANAHPASAIVNTPSGNLLATNVQAALNFLQSEMDTLNAEAASGAFNGISAYQVAVNNGFVGSQGAWLASLVGATGATGATGSTGPQGVQGVQGPEGPPGGAINTNFAVSNTGFIYSNSLTGHVYCLEVAS